MATIQTFGEVTWEEPTPNSNASKGSNKDLYLKLEKGSNELRIITMPQQFVVHNYKHAEDKKDKKKYGQRFNCSMAHGSCVFCELQKREKDVSAKARYLIGVISRKYGAAKILELSENTFGKIKNLTAKKAWSDPTKYDIDIVSTPDAGPAGYYNVIPCDREPLSAEDMKLRDAFDVEGLKRRVVPPTPEKIKERLLKYDPEFFVTYSHLLVDGSSEAVEAPVATPAKKTKVTAPVVVAADEGDEDFTDFIEK